jgi:hypothetical protein
MRILVACEFSQIVTKAFRTKGHEAFSCDIEPTEGNPDWHIQDDVLQHLNDGWDMMIAFPPCTYLAKCGLHFLYTKPERKEQLKKAFEFFLKLYNSSIDKIAIENPEGWINTHWKKPDQIIHPYYFGDSAIKSTCLWLKNLLPLDYCFEDNLFRKKTAIEKPKDRKFIIRKSGERKGQRYYYRFNEGKSAKERSKFWPGIAQAMADQWG